MILWWNDQLLPLDQIRLNPMDHGFLVGDGVFETLLARHGKSYAVTRHWQRLDRSCAAMKLETPTLDQLRHAIDEVLRANAVTDARIRVTVTSGPGPAGSDRGGQGQTLCITATPAKDWPVTEQLEISPWPKFSAGAMTGVKSTSYAENVLALAHAKQTGGGECLFANEKGELCEGTGSNIFLVRQGRLETPPLTSGCLAGVTRALVLETAARLGIETAEPVHPISILTPEQVDEVFVTSTTRDVHPVSRIGSQHWPAPGPVTTRLREAFLEWQAAESDP